MKSNYLIHLSENLRSKDTLSKQLKYYDDNNAQQILFWEFI